MSENARTSKLAAFGKKITAAGKRVVRFFKDIRSELKKVIWPSKEQLVKSTVSVLLICLLIGAVIWISDGLLGILVEWTLKR
ncbi:MAG: preprotein translocase subunit SecE [Clostridiaceae bacterium]|jgi:preprotein translocase subunit SecE|nr:preprotein translocase subunit SecE [Clostridiaceae bacterium]